MKVGLHAAEIEEIRKHVLSSGTFAEPNLCNFNI